MDNENSIFDLNSEALIMNSNMTIGITLTEPKLTNYKEILISEILTDSQNRAVVFKDGVELVKFNSDELEKLFRILALLTVRKSSVSKTDINEVKQTCKIFVAKDLPMTVKIELADKTVYGVVAPLVEGD